MKLENAIFIKNWKSSKQNWFNIFSYCRLVAAIRSSTLPKLTEEDTPRFLSLLEDVFPTADPSSSTFIERKDLQNALFELCTEQELGKEMANRCIQLNDQLKSRTGVAIVGPPGCGKTTIRKLLFEALTKIGETVVQFHVFPGAMPKSRLLGRVDPQTRYFEVNRNVVKKFLSN